MSKLEMLLSAVGTVLAFISATLIPLIVKFKKAKAEITQNKADIDAAQKGEEFAKQMLAMTNYAQEVVRALEKKFETQDTALKVASQSLSLGAVKRECALSELSEKATAIGLPFDRVHWGSIIDGIVKLTREVNVRDKDKPALATAI